MLSGASAPLAVAALLAASGCITMEGRVSNYDLEGPLTSMALDEAGAADGVEVSRKGGRTDIEITVRGDRLGPGLVRFGIQALERVSFDFDFSYNLRENNRGGSCEFTTQTAPAPIVEEMLGHPERAVTKRPNLANLFGTDQTKRMQGEAQDGRIRIVVDGKTYVDERFRDANGGSSSSSGSSNARMLYRGEWLLLEFAADVGIGTPSASSTWKAEFSTKGDVRIVRLPDGPMRCGSAVWTLDNPHLRLDVNGMGYQEGGSVAVATNWSSLAYFGVPPSLALGVNEDVGRDGSGTIKVGGYSAQFRPGMAVGCTSHEGESLSLSVERWREPPHITTEYFWVLGEFHLSPSILPFFQPTVQECPA